MEIDELTQYESELKLKIEVLRKAVQYAKETGYEKVSIEVDLVEVLLENTNLKFE